jgi:hypothetical protein
VNAADTFVVNTTAVDGVISVKYGPVAPSVFNGAPRFLKPTVTNPPLPALTNVEIVTPPAIAEQLNARGNGTAALVTDSLGRVAIGKSTPQARLHVDAEEPGATHLLVTNEFSSTGSSSVWFKDTSTGPHHVFRVTGDSDADVGGPFEFVVNELGLVGLGTTAPDVLLDLSSANTQYTAIDLDNTTDAVSNYRLQVTGSGVPGRTGNFEIYGPAGNHLTLATSGNLGVGRIPGGHRLEVEGDAFKTAGTPSWNVPSDRRIKVDIRPVVAALDTLDRVRVRRFRYAPEYLQLHPAVADRRYLNVIAQEFAEVFPDHVRGSGEQLPDGTEILQVDPWPLTIYSVAAIQELHAKHNAELATLRAANAEHQSETSHLKSQVARQADLIQSLTSRLAQLEARSAANSANGGR